MSSVNNEFLILVFGSLMTYSFMLCFAPQIYKMYKNKSSRDVSGGMCLLQISGNLGGLGLAFLQVNDIWFKILKIHLSMGQKFSTFRFILSSCGPGVALLIKLITVPMG